MKEKWQKLEKWLAEFAPQVLETFNPPASETKLAAVEAELKLKFPPSVRESYLLHDGQRSESRGLFGGNRFMSLDDVVDLVKMQIEIENECEFGDFDSFSMIPVIDLNHSGDFYYVENSINGEETKLIEWWHEEPTRDVKAASFSAFFDDFLSQLEIGNYVFHEFEPHRFSGEQEAGLIEKTELEKIQNNKQRPVEREILSCEIDEEIDEGTIYRVAYKETFRS